MKERRDKGKSKAVEHEGGRGCETVEDDVYRPIFEDFGVDWSTNAEDFAEFGVGEECPLHNEGCEGDEEVDHFISLANMCRDEQLFATYFEDLCQHQDPIVSDVSEVSAREISGPEPSAATTSDVPIVSDVPEPSAQEASAKVTKTYVRRSKNTPVVEKRQVNTLPEESPEMLEDLANVSLNARPDSEEEEAGKKYVVYQSFKLTNECPQWCVGDVFGDRQFFFEVLRQYAVMSKRPVYVLTNDGKKLRAKCHGSNCKWFVYLCKTEAFNPTDYVLTSLQRDHAHTCSEVVENKWISLKWLAQRYMEKIRANLNIPLQSIRQCVDEEFGSTLSRMKAYRAKDKALEGIFGRTGDQYKKLFSYKQELITTHP